MNNFYFYNNGSVNAFNITSADFSGDSYTNNQLKCKTYITDFAVFTYGGTGTLIRMTGGNSFDSTTGTLTFEGGAGDYVIFIYK